MISTAVIVYKLINVFTINTSLSREAQETDLEKNRAPFLGDNEITKGERARLVKHSTYIVSLTVSCRYPLFLIIAYCS